MKYRLEYFLTADEELPLSGRQSFGFEVDSGEKANAVSDFLQLHGIRVGKLFRVEESGEVEVNDGWLKSDRVVVLDPSDLIRRISAIEDLVRPVLQWAQTHRHDSIGPASRYMFGEHAGKLEMAMKEFESIVQQILAKEPQTKPE